MAAFAQRMKTMEGTAAIIRGLFGTMNDPGVISFGGGAPARRQQTADEGTGEGVGERIHAD